jgi:diguanylate cyclase (GGDEF)-like protein
MTSPFSSAPHSAVLYVDPNPERARAVQRCLAASAVDLIFAPGYMAAVTALSRQAVDLVIASFALPEGDGLELLRVARRDHPNLAGALLLQPQELAAAATGLSEDGWDWLLRDDAGAYLPLLPGMVDKWLAARHARQQAAQADAALAQAGDLAALAAASCDHGLAIFDADMRLALCNDGFADYFDYPPALAAPGTPLREMLRFNLRRGDYGVKADDGEVERRLRRLRNGRDFAFRRPSRRGTMHLVEGRHLADGGLVMRFFPADDARAAQAPGSPQEDALTGLPTGALFEALLKHQVRRGSRSGYNGAALVLIDLDGLVDAADRDGADAARRDAARRLARAVRECDVVARLGKDRFGILLIDVNSQENAEIVAGKLLRALAPAYRDGKAEIQLNASMGIAFHPTELMDDAELMALAEKGITEARTAGKNHYKIA